MNTKWAIHWTSGLLLLALLLTSIPWAALEWARPTTRIWLDIHMTLGWVSILLIVSLGTIEPRLADGKPLRLPISFNRPSYRPIDCRSPYVPGACGSEEEEGAKFLGYEEACE